MLNRGADKISVNSPALARPALIDELSRRFGSQCIVVGIDSRETHSRFEVHQLTGDPDKSGQAGRATLDWIREVQERGAGEIVLNCMNQDGVRKGYDIKQLKLAREQCEIPLIASGGAGQIDHFADVFTQARVDGALAASVFHSGAIEIPALRRTLIERGIPLRPEHRQKDMTA